MRSSSDGFAAGGARCQEGLWIISGSSSCDSEDLDKDILELACLKVPSWAKCWSLLNLLGFHHKRGIISVAFRAKCPEALWTSKGFASDEGGLVSVASGAIGPFNLQWVCHWWIYGGRNSFISMVGRRCWDNLWTSKGSAPDEGLISMASGARCRGDLLTNRSFTDDFVEEQIS